MHVLIAQLRSSFHITTNFVSRAKELLHNLRFHAAVFDYFLVDGNSGELLFFMSEKDINVPVILISAEKDIQNITSTRNHKNVRAVDQKTDLASLCRAVEEVV